MASLVSSLYILCVCVYLTYMFLYWLLTVEVKVDLATVENSREQ